METAAGRDKYDRWRVQSAKGELEKEGHVEVRCQQLLSISIFR